MPKPAYPAPGDEITADWAKQLIDWVDELTKGQQVGTASVVVTAASNATVAITFPKPYATPPRVWLTLQSVGSNGQAHTWIASAGITATGCTIAAGRDDATTFSGTLVVAWMAIGTLA